MTADEPINNAMGKPQLTRKQRQNLSDVDDMVVEDAVVNDPVVADAIEVASTLSTLSASPPTERSSYDQTLLLLLGDGVLNLISIVFKQWHSSIVHAVLSAVELEPSPRIGHQQLVLHSNVQPLRLLASFPPPTHFSQVMLSVLVEPSLEYMVRVLKAVIRSIEDVMDEGGVLRMVLDTKDLMLLEQLRRSIQGFVFVGWEDITAWLRQNEAKDLDPFEKGYLFVFHKSRVK